MEILLRDYWTVKKSTFITTNSYNFNTKTIFPSKTFKKIFSFKIFRKCSLHVPNIVTLRDHSTNILRIFRAGWAADFL